MRRNILSCGNKSGEATRWLAQRRLAGHSDVPFCAEACSFNRHAVDPRARTLGAWVMGKLRERAGPMSEDARESRLQSLWIIIEGKHPGKQMHGFVFEATLEFLRSRT